MPLVTAAGTAPRGAAETTIFAVVGIPAPSVHRRGQLEGKQLPVPLGDDFDGAVSHLYGGLVINRVRRHR
jgi:hypothetical protein